MLTRYGTECSDVYSGDVRGVPSGDLPSRTSEQRTPGHQRPALPGRLRGGYVPPHGPEVSK